MCPLVRLPDCIFRRICRIHLRGCQVGMPHHGLNSAHVSAVAQKMDRKRVAQGMRCDVLLDPGPLPIIFDQLPEALTPPLQFVKRSSELIPFKNVSREASRYFASAFFAAWPNGIIRSLCSSRQVIKPTAIFTSESFRLTSSVTRIPVAYKSSPYHGSLSDSHRTAGPEVSSPHLL